MAAVIAMMQLLQSKEELQGYHGLFNSIIEEMFRANGIITEYMAMAGSKKRQVKNCNLNQVLESLLPLINVEARKQNTEILFITGEINDVAADEKEIKQVVLNLVQNSFEAMEKGGVVQLKTYLRSDEIVLEVADNGCGIPLEIMSKLGQPFVTTKEHGTGLGLYVTFKFLEFYEADVKVDSSPSGTKFTIAFKSCGSAAVNL